MDVQQVLNNLVCRNHLRSFLDVNDLLRFRRVSKEFQNQAQDYIRTQKVKTNREIKIDLLKDSTFDEFNKFQPRLKDLPLRSTVRISFFSENLEKSSVFNVHFRSFLKTYGGSVTHLTLKKLELPLFSRRMTDFFDSFPNITHLELEDLGIQYPYLTPSNSSATPSSLRNLKTLMIGNFCFGNTDIIFPAGEGPLSFIVNLVESNIGSLEQLKFPFDYCYGIDSRGALRLAFMCLFSSKVKLVDVDGRFIDDLLQPEDNHTPEMRSLSDILNRVNEKIISIKNPRNASFIPKLSNLERIIFLPRNLQTFDIPAPLDVIRHDWLQLTQISAFFRDRHWLPPVSNVWNFLFGGEIQRENVVKLAIAFEGFQDRNKAEGINQLLPRTIELTTSCPNVKILRIGTNVKQLVNLQKLWTGLPSLEELSLSDCNELKNSDFVGEDPQNPVFLNLKRLKVLKFDGMAVRLKVTDDLFSKVLCHMTLRKLVFFCGEIWFPGPLSIITLDGIRSLLGGIFASTIERLDISGLNFGSGLDEEKKKVEGLFRSSKMI